MMNVKMLLLSVLGRKTDKVSPETVEEEFQLVGDYLSDWLVGLLGPAQRV